MADANHKSFNSFAEYSVLKYHIEFGLLIRDYFQHLYPEITSVVIEFVYAPDCYLPTDDSESRNNYTRILQSADLTDFSMINELSLYKFLTIAPVVDFKEKVRFLIVLDDFPKAHIDQLSSITKEINSVYQYLSMHLTSQKNLSELDNANLVSRISHDMNSLIALIPEEFTKDEALTTRIKYTEILSRDIMYYLREIIVEESTVPVKDLIHGIISGIDFPENVSVNQVFKAEFHDISVDVELIDRAISALINNSIVATQIEGGNIDITVERRINISPFIDHDWLEIEISDTGPGIPAEFLFDIKKPLFTTWKDQGHVGLGISIANKIIEAHNGVLTIENGPDNGVRVIINLPMN
jgi:signal transduction histidine kinase